MQRSCRGCSAGFLSEGAHLCPYCRADREVLCRKCGQWRPLFSFEYTVVLDERDFETIGENCRECRAVAPPDPSVISPAAPPAPPHVVVVISDSEENATESTAVDATPPSELRPSGAPAANLSTFGPRCRPFRPCRNCHKNMRVLVGDLLYPSHLCVFCEHEHLKCRVCNKRLQQNKFYSVTTKKGLQTIFSICKHCKNRACNTKALQKRTAAEVAELRDHYPKRTRRSAVEQP